MKVIIAGSRDIVDFGAVVDAVKESGFEITEVVSGGARGPDKMGEIWAKRNNIPVKQFLPDWDTYGKSAGFRRNREMAEYGDALIALYDGMSRGTKNMIEEAKARNLKVYVHEIKIQ